MRTVPVQDLLRAQYPLPNIVDFYLPATQGFQNRLKVTYTIRILCSFYPTNHPDGRTQRCTSLDKSGKVEGRAQLWLPGMSGTLALGEAKNMAQAVD